MSTKPKFNAYQSITERVIRQLEKVESNGWTKSWVGDGIFGFNVSMSTGDAYRGINQLLLMFEGRSDARWGTYKAWAAAGAQVRKGEKGTQICFFNTLKKERTDGTVDQIPFLKLYTVFNAEQVDNAPAAEPRPEPTPIERMAAVDAWIKATDANIRHGGDVACYSPTLDLIQMPESEQFVDQTDGTRAQNYYGVLLHELTHWTGHKSRCNRDFSGRFGDEAYAFEELIAELGATFACAALGIEAEPREDHAKYLKSWLKVLRGDNKAIVTAAKQAQLAFEFLDAFSTTEQAAKAA